MAKTDSVKPHIRQEWPGFWRAAISRRGVLIFYGESTPSRALRGLLAVIDGKVRGGRATVQLGR